MSSPSPKEPKTRLGSEWNTPREDIRSNLRHSEIECKFVWFRLWACRRSWESDQRGRGWGRSWRRQNLHGMIRKMPRCSAGQDNGKHFIHPHPSLESQLTGPLSPRHPTVCFLCHHELKPSETWGLSQSMICCSSSGRIHSHPSSFAKYCVLCGDIASVYCSGGKKNYYI